MPYKDINKRREYDRKRYKRDRIKMLARKHEAYTYNYAYNKEKRDAYYLANKDRLNEAKRKWRREHYDEFYIQSLIDGARHRAKEKGLDFTITVNDIKLPTTCPVLGIPIYINKGGKSGKDNSPSLDRKDNSIGYVPDNTVVISYRANRLKSNGTVEEFRKIIDYMESNKPIHH